MENLKKLYVREFTLWISVSFIITFIIEILSKRSVWKTIQFFCTKPLVFLFNVLIVMVPIGIAFFFKRRIFVMTLICSILLVLGVTNFIVLSNRVTPFCPTDILLIGDAIKVADNYLSWYLVMGIIIGIILVIIGLLILYKKAPVYEKKIPVVQKILVMAATTLLVLISNEVGRTNGMIPKTFANIAQAYQEYGFVCCFSYGIFDTGISKPSTYNDQVVDEILEKVEAGIGETTIPESTNEEVKRQETIVQETSEGGETQTELETSDTNTTNGAEETSETMSTEETDVIAETKEPEEEKKPNIIFVQLESFFDLKEMTTIHTNQDPILFFHNLMKSYTSGYLHVPVIGAGTANTEFEVITGMNLDFFGPGEYPYKTVLKTKTCESMAYNMKELGYQTHVIHNNTATFYSRDTIFPQLGFDSFTSVEYMNDLVYNEVGWVKDSCLTSEIIKTIESSDEPDLIYTISVQGHGAYPTEPVLEHEIVTVTGLDTTEQENAYTYYANQLREMDHFIRDLVTALRKTDEKCVLVLFGDHLPTLGIEQEMIGDKSLFETPCVIWDNIGLEKQDLSLEAYQLSSYVFNRLGYHQGVMTKYHQAYFEKLKEENGGISTVVEEAPAEGTAKKEYLDQLEIMEYDVLYGNQESLSNTKPYEKSNMRMGVNDIKLKSAILRDGVLYVHGTNFTDASVVYVNDEPMETIKATQGLLLVNDFVPEDGQKIYVAQYAAKDKKILSKTNTFEIKTVTSIRLQEVGETGE